MLGESAQLSAQEYFGVLHHGVSWLDEDCAAAHGAGEFGAWHSGFVG